MKRGTQLMLAVALTVSATACGGGNDANQQPAQQTTPPATGAGTGTPAVGTSGAASAADTEFVSAQVTTARKETGLARLAQERAANRQLKELAESIATEGQRTSEQLEQLAGRSGMRLTQVEGDQLQAERERLSKLSGQAFDREYITEVVADLERMVRDLDAKAASGNADLRDWAAKSLPAWRAHLERARGLKTTLAQQGKAS